MSVRLEPPPAFDAPDEPTGAHFRVVHPEGARRANGHGHALARRAPLAIAREPAPAPLEWLEPPGRLPLRETAGPPRHALEATFAAFAAAGARTLLVTGVGRHTGTTSFVESAGRAIAAAGRGSVVLVDAHAQHPALHRRFGLRSERGLGEALDELYGFDITREEGSQFGVGDWLEVLRAQGRTGRLTARGENRTWVFELAAGRASALWCADAPPAARLGERLLQRGRITIEQRDAALSIHGATARPLGEVLAALGCIEPQDLAEALQQQSLRGIVELVAMNDPVCRFDERADAHVCGGGPGRFRLAGTRALERLLRGSVLDYLKQPFLRSQTPSFVCDTDEPELKVVVAGQRASGLTSASHQAAFGLLLERLARAFDHVLVDAPAVGTCGGAASLAAHADGVLLVVPAESAAGAATRGAIDVLRRAGGRVLGVIMNPTATRRRS